MLLFMMPMAIMAQSSMTDDQVIKYAIREHENGTSSAQIVTKLMQRGVDITQLRRARKKMERLQKWVCCRTMLRTVSTHAPA